MTTGEFEYDELAHAEGVRGDVVLRRRRLGSGPDAIELRIDGVYVMDTLESASEQAMASVALAVVTEPRDVLVAGLGLGFTLDAVLADSRVRRASVVELEPVLVEWLRDGTVPHGPRLLADERVNLVVADIVQAVVEAPESSYDLVLLDVDNGPGQLVHQGNSALYEPAFLRLVRRLLRDDGALVVWSAGEAPDLADALRDTFDAVEVRRHPVRLQDRDEEFWLYLGH